MTYMIFEISCWVLEIKKKIFHFSLFQISNFWGFFYLGLKPPKNLKSCSKNGPNNQIALLSFTIHKKKSTFRH